MSLHIQPNSEVSAWLKRRKFLQAFSSIALSFLLIAGVLLALAYFVLPTLEKTVDMAVAYSVPSIEDEPNERPDKVKLPQKPAPAAAPSMSQKVISAQSMNDVAIPQLDTVDSPDVIEFGSGMDDFGAGWADTGMGAGEGVSGSSFGSTQKIDSALKGNLYDFKQDPKGNPRRFETSEVGPYAKAVESLQRSRFRESAFRDYYKAEQDLYLTHVAIPLSNAEVGPKFFNVEKEVQPKGWVANYSGRIIVPETGTYRFAGIGDDYLVVYIDGRPRLFGCWPSLQNTVRGSWDPSEEAPSHKSPIGQPIIYGDWMKLKKGETLEMNLALGERPGGKVGFVLLIQEKSEDYETDASTGRPILSLFTTGPISESRKKEISEEFGNFRFDWDRMKIWGFH
ncbi:hypothetical protein ACFSSA_04410 [Luteolibacter algae]|uniref:PA14 domain-containing protein n=1 Tax=Luteolibacter algae TaxID=454151 RepID=A0ABW5D4Z0_9BACT